MAIFDEVTKKFYCECGCGQEVTDPLSEYTRGHYPRTDEHRERMSEAKSGLCFLLVEGDYERRSKISKQRYIDDPTLASRISESLTDRFISAETRKRMSKAQYQRYIDYPDLANQISEKLSGLCYLLDEDYEKRSRARRKFLDSPAGEEWRKEASERQGGINWELSEETRKKMRESYYKAIERDPTLTKRRAEKISGENNYNWKGGLRGRYGYGWGAISESIKIRDHWTCQGCGYKGESGTLVAHHIDGYFWNVTERNLITVCYSCNTKAAVPRQEETWKEYYLNKIKEIYSEGGGD